MCFVSLFLSRLVQWVYEQKYLWLICNHFLAVWEAYLASSSLYFRNSEDS